MWTVEKSGAPCVQLPIFVKIKVYTILAIVTCSERAKPYSNRHCVAL